MEPSVRVIPDFKDRTVSQRYICYFVTLGAILCNTINYTVFTVKQNKQYIDYIMSYVSHTGLWAMQEHSSAPPLISGMLHAEGCFWVLQSEETPTGSYSNECEL